MNARQDFQDESKAHGIVRAEIGGAIAVEDAVADDGLVAKPRRHAIHMGIEQQWLALARKSRDKVSGCVNLCGEPSA